MYFKIGNHLKQLKFPQALKLLNPVVSLKQFSKCFKLKLFESLSSLQEVRSKCFRRNGLKEVIFHNHF